MTYTDHAAQARSHQSTAAAPSLNRYMIKMNGAPFLIVTCPRWMDPVAAARAYLLHGEQDSVTVEAAT